MSNGRIVAAAAVVAWTLSMQYAAICDACLETRPALWPLQDSVNFAAVFDAGSSGSRIRIYRWEEKENANKLPDFKESFCSSKRPGVSEYKTFDDIAKHILHFVNKAAKHVPEQLHAKSSIYFMATAGMRLMLEDKANDAIDFIDQLLLNETLNPFHYVSPDNARILSGEEEGLYAWIAANYLAKSFDNYGFRNKKTIGVLELGGASTQIAFVPVGSILAHKVTTLIGGVTYNLYVHSYLIYGQEMVDRWIKDRLYNDSLPLNTNRTVDNPCMLKGDRIPGIDDKKSVTFIGTGEPSRCSRLFHELIFKPELSWRCNPKPCAIGNTYQPTIQSTQRFYIAGAFRYPLDAFGLLSADGNFSIERTTTAAYNYCSTDYDTIKARLNKTESHFLSRICLTGLYMSILFTKAYGFQSNTQQIQTPSSTEMSAMEWPLGAVISAYERQRCRTYCPEQSVNKPCASVLAASASSVYFVSTQTLVTGFIYVLMMAAICQISTMS